MTGFKRAHEFSEEQLECMMGATYHAFIHLGDIVYATNVKGYIRSDYTFCVTEAEQEHQDLIGERLPLDVVSIGDIIFRTWPEHHEP